LELLIIDLVDAFFRELLFEELDFFKETFSGWVITGGLRRLFLIRDFGYAFFVLLELGFLFLQRFLVFMFFDF